MVDHSHEWSEDIENLLNGIRDNSSQMAAYHHARYSRYKSSLLYFRVPTIVLATLGIFTAEGLSTYITVREVFLTNAILAMLTALINSIELFLGVARAMEAALEATRAFYTLSIGIHKILALTPSHRQVSGRIFLDEQFSTYTTLTEKHPIPPSDFEDRLAPAPPPEEVVPRHRMSVISLFSFKTPRRINWGLPSSSSRMDEPVSP